HQVSILGSPDGKDAATQLNRQVEAMGVIAQITDDVVAPGVAVRLAGERHARQAAVANRREQLQRVPPCAPAGCVLRCRLQDRELPTLLSEEVPDRQT